MRAAKHPEQALVAPSGMAVVVFLRPSHFAGPVIFNIVDGEGNHLGDAVAGRRFAATITPGEHFFVTWSENLAAMHATLKAGHIYYVLVDPRWGWSVARVHLIAISVRTGNMEKLQDWIDDTELTESSVLVDYFKDRAEVKEHVRRAALPSDPHEAMERTLLPDDGIPSGSSPR